MKGIHIAERDTQRSKNPKPLDVFINTWSVDGFISEGLQPAELGWGTHEKKLPYDGKKHKKGTGAAIYLTRAGRRYAGAELGSHGGRAFRPACDPQRGHFDFRLFHGAGGKARHLPAHLPLCLSPFQ